jgi:hypothetical protein
LLLHNKNDEKEKEEEREIKCSIYMAYQPQKGAKGNKTK